MSKTVRERSFNPFKWATLKSVQTYPHLGVGLLPTYAQGMDSVQLFSEDWYARQTKTLFTTKIKSPRHKDMPGCGLHGLDTGRKVPVSRPLQNCAPGAGLIGIGQPPVLRSIKSISRRTSLLSILAHLHTHLFPKHKSLVNTKRIKPVFIMQNLGEILVQVHHLFKNSCSLPNRLPGASSIGRPLGMRSLFYKTNYEPSTGGSA